MMRAANPIAVSRMPSHGGPWLDWTINVNRKAAPHNGATDSFQYIAPTPKYAEAYASQTGPGWGGFISYLNYNHGNQAYDPIDSGLNTAFRTPALPNWYALSKVSPKTSAPGTQMAQLQLGKMLAGRGVVMGNLIGFP